MRSIPMNAEPWQNPDWDTVSFRITRPEKALLESMANERLSTTSRLMRELARDFIGRQAGKERINFRQIALS